MKISLMEINLATVGIYPAYTSRDIIFVLKL